MREVLVTSSMQAKRPTLMFQLHRLVPALRRSLRGRGAAAQSGRSSGAYSAKTTLPVLGVPMKGWSLDGLDSLLSTVQMPRGVPVGTLAIGKAGAVNAALLAGQILGLKYPEIRDAVKADRAERRDQVLADSDPRV